MRLGKIALESGLKLVHEKPNEQESLFGLVKLLILFGDVATKAKDTNAAIDFTVERSNLERGFLI